MGELFQITHHCGAKTSEMPIKQFQWMNYVEIWHVDTFLYPNLEIGKIYEKCPILGVTSGIPDTPIFFRDTPTTLSG